MPSIKEISKIISITPADQPILLVGGHGLGKSESLRDKFVSQGYRMITLFVGQMADAGDMIGLPDRTEVDVEFIDENGKTEIVKSKITEFCPPKWWPLDMNEKVVIFLDEINRGRQEIMQCLMDMVLNRKLNGLNLPSETRIIGAMNPLDDGYYQVDELDPAFMDRWNVYEFKPTIEEWISWASLNNVDNNIINFIAKNGDHLDPPESKNCSANKIYSSRRSWVKVSDIMNANKKIERQLLGTMLFGIIGERSTSSFLNFLKQANAGISAAEVMLGMTKKIETGLKKMNVQEVVHLNTQIALWIEENESDIDASDKIGTKYAKNLEDYLNFIQVECMAQFFDICAQKNSDNKKWPEKIMRLNANIADKFVEILNGNDEEEIEWD